MFLTKGGSIMMPPTSDLVRTTRFCAPHGVRNFFTELVPHEVCSILLLSNAKPSFLRLYLPSNTCVLLVAFVPLLLHLVKYPRKWGVSMRFRTAFSLVTLFLVCFTVASWATPVPDRLVPERSFPAPDNPSQSGKIASIGDAAFSLEVTNGQERKTIEFLVDDDTKVEGKLRVGAQATVEYRSADGRNIAIHVVVKPASAFKGW